MTKAIRGLASVRLLSLGLVFVGLLAGAYFLSGSPTAYADEPDTDGDLLPDSVEAAFGTDPNVADSDADGWGDGKEVWEKGTSPTTPDTDGDALPDPTDDDPLDAGNQDGKITVTRSYSSNLEHETLVGTSVREGIGVYPHSGEFVLTIPLEFGPTILEGLSLTYRSGILYNGQIGYNWFLSVDNEAEEEVDQDVVVTLNGQQGTFTESGGSYTSPAGWPFRLTKDTQNQEFHLTRIRGGKKIIFDSTTGLQKSVKDRFGNEMTVSRDGNGYITGITTADGISLTVSQYPGTSRVSAISGPDNREYTFVYNCKGDLARLIQPDGATIQFWTTYGAQDVELDHNLTVWMDPMGRTVVQNRYDTSDRVYKQVRGEEEFKFTYGTSGGDPMTTVFDWAGNMREWTFGSPVPTKFVAYANRNVNPGNPASWATTYSYNSNFLRTQIVLPRGNSIKFTWDPNYCMTQVRVKQDGAAPDDNTADLVWSYTYGQTYFQLKNSTDPRGSTTTRTLDSLERVTQKTHPTISNMSPPKTISESFTWLANGKLSTHTDGEGSVLKYVYYSSGPSRGLLWKEIQDFGTGKLNLTKTYAYNSARFKVSETDPDGNAWSFEVDPLGRVTKKTSPSSLDYETNYAYNAAGQLTRRDVENVDGAGARDSENPWWTTTHQYGQNGLLSSRTEEISATETRATTLSYTANGRVEMITLPEGNKLRFVYDERGKIYRFTRGYDSPDAATEEFGYGPNGNVVSRTDALAKVWTATFDLFGRRTKETSPLGHYKKFEYDKNENMTAFSAYDSSDNLLLTRIASYDEIDRPFQIDKWLDKDDDGIVDSNEWLSTQQKFDGRSKLVKSIDPQSYYTTYGYDGAGRRTSWEDHLGNKVTYGYSGDCCSATEIEEVEVVPGGGTETYRTEMTVDSLNRVTSRKVIDLNDSANYRTTSYGYSSLSVVVSETDPEGNATSYEHDGLRRILKREIPASGTATLTSQYVFDKNDNLIEHIDDGLNSTTYRYNERDVVYEVEYDDGEKWTMTLRGDDQPSAWTDPNGSVVANTYDSDGRLTSRTITRATDVLGPTSETFSWDGLGRMTLAQNTNSTVESTYDTLSRLVSETQGPNPMGSSGKTIEYTYDDSSVRSSCDYFSGYSLDHTSDAIGRWTKIEDSSSVELVTWTYCGPSRRTSEVAYDNGTSVSYTYDGFRYTSDLDHQDSSSAVFAGFDYGYDKLGNMIFEELTHDSGKGNIYAYDQASRLLSALIRSDDPSAELDDGDWLDYPYSKKIDITLDDIGNRTSVATTPYGGQANTTTYSVNSLNQYSQVLSTSWSHDNNGNRTIDGAFTYYYSFRNELVMVMSGTSVVAEYEYDALGRRTEKTVGSDTTRYYYDHGHVVEEYDGSDTLLRKFVYGQDVDEIRVMIAPDISDVDDDGNTSEELTFFFHTNALGSVTHVTDPSEAVVEQYEYLPYGMTTIKDGSGSDLSGSSAIGNPYMYTARRYDEETGLYYYRFRTYDPEHGRFLQRDPLGTRVGPNLYEYVQSNPTSWTDPSGLKGKKNPYAKHFKDCANKGSFEECVACCKAANDKLIQEINDREDQEARNAVIAWLEDPVTQHLLNACGVASMAINATISGIKSGTKSWSLGDGAKGFGESLFADSFSGLLNMYVWMNATIIPKLEEIHNRAAKKRKQVGAAYRACLESCIVKFGEDMTVEELEEYLNGGESDMFPNAYVLLIALLVQIVFLFAFVFRRGA